MKDISDSRIQGTYFFFNLGCPKNLVDAEFTAARLEEAGWSEAPSPQDAALLVVTTCAFISEAVEESIAEILRVASLKKKWQLLAVLGCLVSREGKDLAEFIPEVDIFLDVKGMRRLPELLERIAPSDRRSVERVELVAGRKLFTPPHIAYLKISDGCSNHCSYCKIPAIRGELVSREGGGIIDEAEHLLSAGVKELVIVAQDTSAWGFERGNRGQLYDLLEDLGGLAESRWIRLMYLHPAHIEVDRLIGLMESGAVCPYLDIPVQHVSDRILSLMKRGYVGADLERIFGTLRARVNGLVLRTTVMVGFPGETDAEFRELADFLDRYMFDHVGVFVYSPEKGTEAALLGPMVPLYEAVERRDEILDLQMDISQERLSRMIGRDERILVDEILPEVERPRKEVWGMGRFYGQAYDVDGVVFLTGRISKPGVFVNAYVEEAQAYDLFADVK